MNIEQLKTGLKAAVIFDASHLNRLHHIKEQAAQYSFEETVLTLW